MGLNVGVGQTELRQKSFGGNENVLQLLHRCIQLPKFTKLYTFNRCILLYVSYLNKIDFKTSKDRVCLRINATEILISFVMKILHL